jgi:hypothetical protein
MRLVLALSIARAIARAIAPAIALAAAACGGAPAPAPPSNSAPRPAASAHEPVATLERTECYGWCPAYKITIYRDGVVDYVGTRFVKLVGEARGQLTTAQLAQLDQLFEQTGYLHFKDRYVKTTVTDMPSANTSYAPPGEPAKSVQHYDGDRSAPKELAQVEDGIDQIVRIEQWIGTTDERRGLGRN